MNTMGLTGRTRALRMRPLAMGLAAICAARARPMPMIRTKSSAVQRASPWSPPCAASSALATVIALPRRDPLPITSATNSLSPSAAAPR